MESPKRPCLQSFHGRHSSPNNVGRFGEAEIGNQAEHDYFALLVGQHIQHPGDLSVTQTSECLVLRGRCPLVRGIGEHFLWPPPGRAEGIDNEIPGDREDPSSKRRTIALERPEVLKGPQEGLVANSFGVGRASSPGEAGDGAAESTEEFVEPSGFSASSRVN